MGMQLHNSFGWVDYVCSGQSDYSFPELVKCLFANQPVEGIPGLIYREGKQSRRTAEDDQIKDMDALPDPDFDDYFSAIERSKLRDRIPGRHCRLKAPAAAGGVLKLTVHSAG